MRLTDKTYSMAIQQDGFNSRLEYLSLWSLAYESPRFMSNKFYKSPEWLYAREQAIIRDQGCDLGIQGLYVEGKIIVHHIDPLTEEDILEWNADKLFSLDNLITCSTETHNLIHYKREVKIELVERKPGDTNLW